MRAVLEHAAIRPRMCSGCPFGGSWPQRILRADLGRDRRLGFAYQLAAGESFICHKEAHDEEEQGRAGARMCTGAATVLEREGKPNLIMRVAVMAAEPPFVNGGDAVPYQTVDEWVEDEEAGR